MAEDQDIVSRFAAALSPEAPAAPAEAPEEVPVVADEQPEEVPQEADTEVEEAEEAPAEEDAGFVELELESGQTYKVPQEVKDGYLRNADYTRKTQDLANLQKNAQATLMQNAMAQRFQQETASEQQELMQIQAQLKQLKNIDWTSFDTETYIKQRAYADQLSEKAKDIETSLGKKHNELQQQFKQARSEAAKNAYEFIGRHVSGWKPDSNVERETAAYANALGVTNETLAEVAVLYPGFAVMAAKAREFDRLQAGKGQAVQKAQKAPPVVKPGAVVQSNTLKARAVKQARENVRKTGSVDALQQFLLVRGMK